MITDRIDAVTRIPPEYMMAAPPAPKSVKIELSPRCNFRCSFCALGKREVQPKRDMDLDLFKRISREMRAAGVQEIGVFYLGEPFMGPRLLVDCIDYLKSDLATPYVYLCSNASLAFPSASEACMQAGLDSLKWSVNASDPAQFERITGVSGRMFHWALKNIQASWELRREHGYKTRLYASSIRYDDQQQAAMESLLQKQVIPYVDQHYWLPLYSRGAFATGREAQLGCHPSTDNPGRPGALHAPLPCLSPFTEGHVTAEGKLSACCFNASANWSMGDLNRQTFMAAWNAPAFVNLRAAHLKGDVRGTACENCAAYS